MQKENYLGFGNRARIRKIGRNIMGQKNNARKVLFMAIDQKAQEAVEKVDSCCDGCELFRIAKKRLERRKILMRLVVLKMKVGW